MQFRIDYELDVNGEPIKDTTIVLASSRRSASDRFLAVIRQRYASSAIVTHLDIRQLAQEEEHAPNENRKPWLPVQPEEEW